MGKETIVLLVNIYFFTAIESKIAPDTVKQIKKTSFKAVAIEKKDKKAV